MSTHYGRMIHEDDRTIMFANPEDAAEYIGFDLTADRRAAVQQLGAPATSAIGPRRGGTVYEKDGEKYFVVDSHMHYWNAAPDNWVQGAEQYAKGWIECFHAYQGLGPPETHWSIEKFQKYSEDDLMKDVFEDGYVDVAVFQPTYLKEWYTEGFNTTERNAALGEKHPGKFIANTRFDPRDGDAGPGRAHAQRRDATARRASSSTPPSGTTARAATSSATPAPTASWRRPRTSASRTSTCTRARRSGRWTRTRSTSPTSTTRDRLPRPELHRRARRPAPDRGLLLHGDAGAQRLRRPVRGHRRPDARPAEVLRQGHGRAAVLGRRGQDDLRQRLRHLGAEVADRGLRRLGLPAATSSPTTPGEHRDQEEDPRPERGQALRHRGAGRVPAQGRRHARRPGGARPAR